MRAERAGSFAQGVAAGGGGALATAMLLLSTFAPDHTLVASMGGMAAWAHRNLGLSLPLFGLVLLLFLHSMRQLRKRIDSKRPLEEVAQADHLADTWTSLFFGIGVIWTAIGMRDALLYALGDPGAAVDGGAFEVLRRMVDGGILLALSTTIFGGVGGYLMRVVKTVTLGNELKRYWDETASAQGREIVALLSRIEGRLEALGTTGRAP